MSVPAPLTIAAPAGVRDAVLASDGLLLPLLTLLNDEGEETRIVGGAIRNALLGKPIADIDLATTLRPQEVMTLLEQAGHAVIATGIAHGTVTAIVEGRPFEITTLRQDIETDGRHAKVAFGRDFAADALRRDFTINALSLGLDGVLHDYARGLADIQSGTVRFIGDAQTRIQEDYLRILRFFRFSAFYGRGTLDQAGLAACAAEQGGIDSLSRERIGQEMRKLLVAERAGDALAAMAGTGILERALRLSPQIETLSRLMAIESEAGLEADVIRRLAAVAPPEPGAVEVLRNALKLSNVERDRLLRIESIKEGSPDDLPSILYRFGNPAVIDRLCLDMARGRVPPDKALILHIASMSVPKNPFRAIDFLAGGMQPGKALGAALSHAEQAWIRAGFPMDPTSLDRLIAMAREAVQP